MRVKQEEIRAALQSLREEVRRAECQGSVHQELEGSWKEKARTLRMAIALIERAYLP